MGEIRLGCSGWDYDEWRGPFYRRRTGSKLGAYSRVFDTVEINSTFYRAPTPGMVLGWTRYSPDDFVYAAKVPQTVTHDRLLKVEKGADREVAAFCDLMGPLADAGKLGVLLLQLPPRLEFHPERVRAFFEALPGDVPFAVEFRNATWMRGEALDLLRAHEVAYTVVDEPLLPPEVHVTAPIAYVRWHGHGSDPWYNYRYSREELEPWVPRLQDVQGRAGRVFGYFNNHFHGYAPENCLEVLEMLEALTPEQASTLQRMRDHREGILQAAHGKVKATTLEDFASPGEEPLLRLLGPLSTKPRVDRGREIATEGLAVDVEGGVVRADVGPYFVLVDRSERLLRHDCEDWKKHLPDGLLCKHVVAVLLTLPPKESRPLLQALRGAREEWTFSE